MTTEQAKSELMQLYMSLSEEKKKALDVLMAQADEEKTCGTCRNNDTYHCAECENKSDYEQSQADGEYISKDKMLMFLNDMRYGIAPDETVADDDERREREAQVDVLDDLMEVVEQMPSVAIPSAEPKTGHWIEKDGFDGDVYYDCSECGESWTTIEGTPWQNGMDYCPNCGAKMVEPQESEE